MILWRFNSRDKIVSNKTLFIVYEQRAEGQDLQIKDVVIYCNHCFHVIVMFIYFCFIYPCYIPWFTLCRQAISYTQRLSFKHVLYSRFSTDFDKFFEARFEKGRLLLLNLRTESLQVCQKSTPFSLFFRLCHKFVSIHVLTFSFCKFQHILYLCVWRVSPIASSCYGFRVSTCTSYGSRVSPFAFSYGSRVSPCTSSYGSRVPPCIFSYVYCLSLWCFYCSRVLPLRRFRDSVDRFMRKCQNIFNRSIKLQKTIS